MTKVAILTCLKACQICTGASCLAAWNSRTRNFAQYAGQDAELVAFMHCNGCDKDPAIDPGMQEKLERLAQIGVDRVHLGVCTRTEQADHSRCPRIQNIVDRLEAQGVAIVEGTH